METKVKIFFALTIPYAFLCAGLYHLSFWTPFGIHIFSFLDIADIIKSIISPFFYSSFAAMVLIFFQYTPTYDIYPYGGGNTGTPSKWKKILWISLKLLYSILILFLLIGFDDKWKGQFVPWVIAPGLYHVVVEFLLKKEVIKHSKYNFLTIYILVLLPIFSFTTGTANAKKIYENKQFDYALNIIPKKPLKFLSKASDYYVFVSLDNKDKYFFSVDEIKGLNLREYKSK